MLQNLATREMNEVLPDVDLVIELLDARLPFSSQNPTITALRGNKPGIKILSKSDLAEPEAFSSTNRCRQRVVVR